MDTAADDLGLAASRVFPKVPKERLEEHQRHYGIA
jgi:hypothetical protein